MRVRRESFLDSYNAMAFAWGSAKEGAFEAYFYSLLTEEEQEQADWYENYMQEQERKRRLDIAAKQYAEGITTTTQTL